MKKAAPLFLMCPPACYGVRYVINPWMRGNEGTVDPDRARAQWNALYSLLTGTLEAEVRLIEPDPAHPDMVFTANGGLPERFTTGHPARFIPSRFAYPQRRGEEPHFIRWFRENGWNVQAIEPEASFEGAGDALYDEGDPSRLWAASGFRTDEAAHATLKRLPGLREVVSLRPVDPRYYHLDTCFCPLPGGRLLWYPPAFDAQSRRAVESRVLPTMRHAVSAGDAEAFACNAVTVGERAVVLNDASDALAEWLAACGFRTYRTPLGEFMKAGGAAKCLTLRLNA